MNRKYISVILLMLALVGSTILLRVSAMSQSSEPARPNPTSEHFDYSDIDSSEQGESSSEEGAPMPAAQHAGVQVHGNAPQWYSDIAQNIFHNQFHTALNQIQAISPNQLNFQDSEGWTILHWAALKGRWDICIELLRKGINKNLTNQDDETAADVADQIGNAELAKQIRNYQ